MLGRVLASTVTACILAAGVLDLWAVCTTSGIDVNYEKEPLVKGLVFRNSVIYKIPGSVLPPTPTREDSSKLPVSQPVRICQSHLSQLFKAATGMEGVSLTAHEALRSTVPETSS